MNLAIVAYVSRKALCWPVNVEEHPVDSLLCTAEEERSARFIRYPAPIMPISRNRKRQRKEDDDAAMDSFEEDSEIDEILAGRPSPSTPFEHSPILYKRLELLFNRKCQVNVDESFRRNVIMGITRKLGNILEMSRELHRALEGDGAVAGNGQFVLELARVAAIPETVIESAEARFKSAIQALNERPT